MVVYVQHALRVTETRMPIIRFMIICLLRIAYIKLYYIKTLS